MTYRVRTILSMSRWREFRRGPAFSTPHRAYQSPFTCFGTWLDESWRSAGRGRSARQNGV
jgi:hypothetical protein